MSVKEILHISVFYNQELWRYFGTVIPVFPRGIITSGGLWMCIVYKPRTMVTFRKGLISWVFIPDHVGISLNSFIMKEASKYYLVNHSYPHGALINANSMLCVEAA